MFKGRFSRVQRSIMLLQCQQYYAISNIMAHTKLQYDNKTILAPMVRAGTLPLRMVARMYGADIAYGEELIDRRIMDAKRVENEVLGTVDLIKDKSLVFRTCAEDHPTVFQLGSANPEFALAAALKVVRDVDAIDVNMGCPKHFSIHNGMGSALLSTPQLAKEILSTLIRNLDKPVTCKIRLLDTVPQTIDFMRAMAGTGIRAIAVHARRVPERPRHPAHWDELHTLVSESVLGIPIIGNGDVFCYADIARFKEVTGVSSVMIARAALANPSIFRPAGLLSAEEVAKEYILKSVDSDNPLANTKYTLTHILSKKLHTPLGKAVQKAQSLSALCELFGVEEYYRSAVHKRKARAEQCGDSEEELAEARPEGDEAGEGMEEQKAIRKAEEKE